MQETADCTAIGLFAGAAAEETRDRVSTGFAPQPQDWSGLAAYKARAIVKTTIEL
jgi:hypothetical protein